MNLDDAFVNAIARLFKSKVATNNAVKIILAIALPIFIWKAPEIFNAIGNLGSTHLAIIVALILGAVYLIKHSK